MPGAAPPSPTPSPGVREYLAWARGVPSGPREAARYREPLFEGARATPKAAAAARELHDAHAALSKAVVRPGEGGACPRDGDELRLHLTLRATDGAERLLATTRAGEGGSGVPLRALLGGASCTLLRGVELALSRFTRGERAVLRLTPEFAYGHECCVARGLAPPRGFSAKEDLFAEVELLDFQPAKAVRDPPELVTKRILEEGRGIETPHAPYEVEVCLSAALPAAWPDAASGPSPAAALIAPSRVLSFALGAGAAPPALEAAIASMRPGERAAVFCAAACALRPAAALPELPSSAPDGVEYVVALRRITQVRDLYGDGSLLKRRVAAGKGDFPVDCPIHDCRVRLHVAARALPGRELVFDSRAAEGGAEAAADAPPLEFELATGAQPPGLEAAVRLMVPGETAVVTAAARHGYDALPRGTWARPAALAGGAGVEWEVTLLGFDRPLNWYQASVEECLAEAARGRAAGVALYRGGAWALARARFEQLAAQLAGLRGLEGAEEAAALALRGACLLNAAAAAQQLGEHAAAAARCTEVLTKVDPDSAKARFRRAVSCTALGDWEGAAEDLAAAREADPSAAPDCDRQAAKLRAAQRDAAAQQRTQMRGFLAKPAAEQQPATDATPPPAAAE